MKSNPCAEIKGTHLINGDDPSAIYIVEECLDTEQPFAFAFKNSSQLDRDRFLAAVGNTCALGRGLYVPA